MKRALVTGANRGIGYAIAKGLVGKGYQVLLGARDAEAGKRAAAEIGATAVQLDVSSQASIEQAVREIGEVDVLINNAGILGEGSVIADISEYDQSMAVMVRGPFLLMHYLCPAMVAKGYGRVVNLTSGWGSFHEGLEGPGAYGVAKAALNAITLSASRNLPNSVKVNAMCPGWVHTEMGGKEAPRTPEQGADTAIWLATLDDNGPTGGFFRDREAINW